MAKAKPKAKPPATTVSTIAAAASRLGVHPRTLKEWLAGGAPGKEGAYDVEAIRAWRAATRKAQPASEGGRAKWEERKARAEALIKELRYRESRGQLVSVARASQVVRQHISEVNTHLDQLPDYAVASSRLPTEQKKKLRERIKAKVRDLRATLERSLRALAKAAQTEGKQETPGTDEE